MYNIDFAIFFRLHGVLIVKYMTGTRTAYKMLIRKTLTIWTTKGKEIYNTNLTLRSTIYEELDWIPLTWNGDRSL
jgi:hypothetical protein